MSDRELLEKLDRYERAKDELLFRMADAIGVCLNILGKDWPTGGPDKAIHQLSDAMEKFRQAR